MNDLIGSALPETGFEKADASNGQDLRQALGYSVRRDCVDSDVLCLCARQSLEDAAAVPRQQEASIFAIGRVQYSLPAPLTHLVCSANILLLALASQPPRLVRIDLNDPDEEEHIDITGPATQNANSQQPIVHKIFCDPTGKHILVVLTSADTSYVYTDWNKDPTTGRKRSKPLAKLKGALINAVAWSPVPPSKVNASSTRPVLLGTVDGHIIEICLDGELESSNRPFARTAHLRYVRQLITLRDPDCLDGLKYHLWKSGRRRVCIIATTRSRILQFISLAGNEDALFEVIVGIYKDATPSKQLTTPLASY